MEKMIINYRFITIIVFVLCMSFKPMCQNKYALLVGISEYPSYDDESSTWNKIHGANDVRLIKPILQKRGFEVRTLTDKQATYKSIVKELDKLDNKVVLGDIVYIHFSGHGQAVEDLDGDEKDGWDESFIPYDAQKTYRKGQYTGENHLLDDKLNKNLTSIRTNIGPKGLVFVVLDACHAGSSYRGEENDSAFVRGSEIGFSATNRIYAPRIDKRGNIRILSHKDMSPIYMLEACRSYEVNTEILQDNKYFGPLSYYISKELLTSMPLSDIKWIDNVRKNMDKDIRLIRQHLVLESSQ